MDEPRRYELSQYEVWLIVRGLQLLEERYDTQPKRERIERLRRLVAGVQAISFTPYQRAASSFSDDTASAAEKRDRGPQPVVAEAAS